MTAIPLAVPPPTTPDALERIEDRLASLERVVTRAERALEQLPQLIALGADTFDQHMLRAVEAGIDPGERIAALLTIAERLTTPAALNLAETLVGHVPNLQRLFDSELLSPGALNTVGQAGSALAAAADGVSQPAGLLTLVRALRDPSVQRSLGFALRFAQLFGRALEPAERALPARTTP